jgi:hypothetical protein
MARRTQVPHASETKRRSWAPHHRRDQICLALVLGAMLLACTIVSLVFRPGLLRWLPLFFKHNINIDIYIYMITYFYEHIHLYFISINISEKLLVALLDCAW